MKATVFSIICVATLMGCSTKTKLVQQSPYVITTPKEDVVYIRDSDIGSTIYESWRSGAYGPCTVHLMDSSSFENLKERHRVVGTKK